MDSKLYHYKATIVSVWDGDTCTAEVDLGFGFSFNKIKLRLDSIDAPELRGETLQQGRGSRDYLRSLILDKEVILETIKEIPSIKRKINEINLSREHI